MLIFYIYIECIGRSIGYMEFILSAILIRRKWTMCETKELSQKFWAGKKLVRRTNIPGKMALAGLFS